MLLSHLASRLYGTPLLIARPKLDVILSVLGSRIGLPDMEMAMPLSAPKAVNTPSQAGIAVIPVVGTPGQTGYGYRGHIRPDVLWRDRGTAGGSFE